MRGPDAEATIRLDTGLATGILVSSPDLFRTCAEARPRRSVMATTRCWAHERCLPLNADAEEQPAALVIRRAREGVYDVAGQETGKDPEHSEAFASSLRGTRLLNI